MECGLLIFVADTLLKAFQRCLHWRQQREPVMEELLGRYCFAALIKTVRKIHAEYRRINVVVTANQLQAISTIITKELSPTAAMASCYDREAVIREFGSEMKCKIEDFQKACLSIDCNTAPGASVPTSKCQIEPSCTRAEMLWDEIVEIYCEKVCPLGWIGKSIKKRVLEARIESSMPRTFPYP